MSLLEIFTGSGIGIGLLLGMIQISKIPINPWSWIARKVGRAINGEVIKKVDDLGKGLTSLRAEFDEREAVTCRTRIMRFGDEILHGTRHSKEHFDQILLDITYYEDYCKEHEKFKNNVAVATIDMIKECYKKRLAENDFL